MGYPGEEQGTDGMLRMARRFGVRVSVSSPALCALQRPPLHTGMPNRPSSQLALHMQDADICTAPPLLIKVRRRGTGITCWICPAPVWVHNVKWPGIMVQLSQAQ